MVHFSLAFQLVPCSWCPWFNVIIREQSHSNKECITLLILFLKWTILCNMPLFLALPAFLVTVVFFLLWCFFSRLLCLWHFFTRLFHSLLLMTVGLFVSLNTTISSKKVLQTCSCPFQICACIFPGLNCTE